MQAFAKELEFFKENQEEFVRQHSGKFLVLVGRNLVGIYPTAIAAYVDSQKKYRPGSFMIQPCTAGPDAYTVTIATANVASYST